MGRQLLGDYAYVVDVGVSSLMWINGRLDLDQEAADADVPRLWSGAVLRDQSPLRLNGYEEGHKNGL